ncbi:MAG TPA: CHASE domain-containing protein [Rudaea sp.]|nr:CHASE domain-containing protein [Rudaea sp.]
MPLQKPALAGETADKHDASQATWIATARVVAIVVGCGISAAAFYWSGVREQQRIHETLSVRSDWRADDLVNKITQAAAPVQALAAFVASQTSVNAEEFGRFAAQARAGGPVARLAWFRLVADGERDSYVDAVRRDRDPGYDIRERGADGRMQPAPRRAEYLAAEFQASFDDRPSLLGYDLLSEPARRDTAQRSRDAGVPLATPAIVSVVSGDGAPSLMILYPVYREGVQTSTAEQRHDALRGFATGLFRADALARFAIEGTPEIIETLSISVAPVSATSSGMRWVLGASVPGGVEVLGTPTPPPAAGALRFERSFERLGSKWQLTFDYPPETVAGLTARARWGFLLLGIPLTLLIAETISRGVRRRMEIEQVVIERTRQLQRISAELDAVIEASPIAIICLDSARRITLWNRAAEEAFGYAAAEVIGQPDRLVAAEQARDFDAWLSRIAGGETLRGIDARCIRKDGAPIETSLSGARLIDASGATSGTILAFQDRTARNLLQQQLAQSQKMESIGQLTGGLAHDFNNILGVIIGNFELLEDHMPANSRPSEYRRAGLKAALSAADLVRRLLAFSRRQPLQPTAVDIAGVLSGVQPLLRRSIGERIDVRTTMAADLWRATADTAQLESAILNLAINARDAMPRGGTLRIDARNTTVDHDALPSSVDLGPGDYVAIAVSDTGCGMSAETAARAIEPFFTTKGPHAGSGLGLSMVYGTMRQLGGTATIYSEVGVGTTVRLYLPRARGPDGSPSRESIAPVPAPTGRERVLLVEDNAEIRTIATRMLAELGYQVAVAEDAAAALSRVQRGERFDVLFTDIVMPGALDGIALAHAVRKVDADLAVLLASGFASPELARAEIDALGAGFITKPYRRSELANVLRVLLARRAQGPKPS